MSIMILIMNTFKTKIPFGILISVVLIFTDFLIAESVDIGTEYFIIAEGGLRLRNQPNQDGSVITLIPFGKSVVSLNTSSKTETISGKTGKWHQVNYQENKKKYTGWVFGGFISKLRVWKKCTSLEKLQFPVEIGMESFVDDQNPDNYSYGKPYDKSSNSPDNEFWYRFSPEEMVFQNTYLTLNENKTGFYHAVGMRGLLDEYDIPLTWRLESEKIEIEGKIKINKESYLYQKCSLGISMSDECRNGYFAQAWAKKFGNVTDAEIKYYWTMSFSKKGEVLITQRDINDDFQLYNMRSFNNIVLRCGY